MLLINGFISGPYSNIWVGKAEVSDVSSCYHSRVAHVAPLNTPEHVPNQTTNLIGRVKILGLIISLQYTVFLEEPVKLDSRLAVLKIFMIF